MVRLVAEMWRIAADAYVERHPAAADLLRVRDDEIDDLHVTLSAELARGSSSNAVAIEMGLIARFYERLGDHAVNVTRRLCELRRPSGPTYVGALRWATRPRDRSRPALA